MHSVYGDAGCAGEATNYDTGNISVATDVNGATTTYTYGACGDSFPTTIVTAPVALTQQMTWDCTGGVTTSSTDPNSKVASVHFSDLDFWRPDYTTDLAGNQTTFTYPSPVETESTLSFNSGTSVSDHFAKRDVLGRISVSQTRQGPGAPDYDSIETDYDALGRLSQVTQPYSAMAGTTNSSAPRTITVYDALGRPSTITDGGGKTISYGYTSNDVLQTIGPAPLGESTKRKQFEYDGLGRLTSVCEITSASGSGTCGQTTPQTGYWTKYTYNAIGNLTNVSQNAQPGGGTAQARTFGYDLLGRMTSEANPETGTTNYYYDSLTSDAAC